MGGQVADTGIVVNSEGMIVAEVTNVKKAPNGQFLHTVTVKGQLIEGTEYFLQVNIAKHNKTIKNHTATHMLHKALKEVLGSHANQAGSLVAPEHLRFDFTHFGQVTPE